MSYIVRREISDNGPMGSTFGYVKVEVPRPNETIYHGEFTPSSVSSGQFDKDTTPIYIPKNEAALTSETYRGGVETF